MRRIIGFCFAALLVVALVGVSYAERGRLHKGRYIRGEKTLPLAGFFVNDQDNAPDALTENSTPGIEYDDYQVGVVWADGETTPIEQTFVVPSDFKGEPAFEAFFTRSSTGDGPSVDFEIYINRDMNAADSSATDQTAVEVNNDYVSSPQKMTLTPATDGSNIQAGDRVTVRIWRDDTDTSSDDLEMKGDVLFIYDQY